MTLDEKFLEIRMIDTRDHPREVPAIERLGIPAFKITNGPPELVQAARDRLNR